MTPTLLIISIAASIDRLDRQDGLDIHEVRCVLADHIAIFQDEDSRAAIMAIFGGRLPRQYDPSLMPVWQVDWPDDGYDNPCPAEHRTYAAVAAATAGEAVAMVGNPRDSHVSGTGVWTEEGPGIMPRDRAPIHYIRDPAIKYWTPPK